MFDKKLWSIQKQEQRRKAYEMIDQYGKSMMQDAHALQQYLNVQSRLDCYSVSNAMLIAAQYPQACQLKSFAEWKEQKVTLQKNAVKITILEPGKPYQRHDGSTGISYNAKTVFDISQTSADKQPPKQHNIRSLVSALIYVSPVSVQVSDDLHGMTAHYEEQQGVIFVQRGLGEMQMFTGIAQAVLSAVYNLKYDVKPDKSAFQCYCAAYMLSNKYGMDVSEFHFDAAPDELKDSTLLAFKVQLNSIRTAFTEVNKELRHVMYKRQERDDALR